MYRHLFENVAKTLSARGIVCDITDGEKLSDSDLVDLSQSLGLSFPGEFSSYLRELGDGFTFQWDHPRTGDLMGFKLSYLVDIKSEFLWLQEQIGVAVDSNSPAIASQAVRRLSWLPIIGIGEGGYELCLDCGGETESICYYEAHWQTNPDPWAAVLAPSLRALITRWSRYCFTEPILQGSHVGLVTFAGDLTGEFNWSPNWFDPDFIMDDFDVRKV